MTTKEITIYEQTNKNGVLHLYCQSCKPRGGKKGTLVTGSYDHCCQGCGEDFLEMAEDIASLQEIMSGPRVGPYTFEELTQFLTRPQDVLSWGGALLEELRQREFQSSSTPASGCNLADTTTSL